MNTFTGSVNQTCEIVGSCLNCTTPANLLATLSLILIGVALAVHFNHLKSAP